jgi:hypothetical protein
MPTTPMPISNIISRRLFRTTRVLNIRLITQRITRPILVILRGIVEEP